METKGKVAVFGVPTAAGARRAGMERAAFALREAGLLKRLREAGATVVNLSDLSLFPWQETLHTPTARNADVVACAVRATADETERALAEGFTVVLGGDCSIVVGTVAGARRARRRPVGVVYIDADADLNTPDTTPSGYLDGMALALAFGRGPLSVAGAGGEVPAAAPEHTALLGFRALDPGERGALGDLGLALPAAAVKRLGMRVASALALDAIANQDGPIVVHLDVDAIDYDEMPAKDTRTPGQGLTFEETSDLVTALCASPRVVALEMTEFNPSLDPQGTYARRFVDLLVRAISRRLQA